MKAIEVTLRVTICGKTYKYPEYHYLSVISNVINDNVSTNVKVTLSAFEKFKLEENLTDKWNEFNSRGI